MNNDLLSTAVLCPDVFLYLVFILFNDAVCRLNNVICRAVILFQFEQLGIGVVFLEIQDVANVRPAKRINGLCIIPHNTNVLIFCSKRFNDEVLTVVGILILVYQNVLKPTLVLRKYFRELVHQFIGLQQQIIEVHTPGSKTTFGICLIDLSEHGHFCRAVLCLKFSVLEVCFWCNQVVFK